MANSQNRRNTSGKGGSGKGGSGKAGGSTKARPPINKNKAMADARKAAAKSNNQTIIWIVASVVVVGLIVAGIIAVTSQNEAKEAQNASEVQDIVDDVRSGIAAEIPPPSLTDGVITYGNADAPVVVEYWVDMLCPACRQFELQAAETMEEYIADGTVQLQVHQVAILNQASNPPGYSTRAGASVICAAEAAPDNADSYTFMKALYEMQPAEGGPGLSDQRLVEIGTAAGLGGEFQQCVTGGTHESTVAANTQTFDENGYPGTPTVVVDGTQLKSGSLEELTSAIEAAKA